MNIQVYLTANTLSELTCFLAAFFFLLKDKEAAWRLLIIYLLLTCATEIEGIHLRLTQHHNSWLYNIFVLAECAMNSYFFYVLLRRSPYRRWLLFGWSVIFMVTYVWEGWQSHFSMFVSNTTTVMGIAFTLASIYYYYLLLLSPAYANLKKHASFWWVNGTIFFYFGSTATDLFFDYLIHYKAPGFGHSVYYVLLSVLNVLLYCCWIYSFYCRWSQRK